MQRGNEHQNSRGIEHAIDERCDNVRARLRHSDAREVIFVGNFERCGNHSVGEHVAKGERNRRLQNCDDEHGAYRRTKRAELCSPGAQENAVDKNHHGAFAIKQQIACVSVDERQNEAVDEANNEARRRFERECRKRRARGVEPYGKTQKRHRAIQGAIEQGECRHIYEIFPDARVLLEIDSN